MADNYNKKVLIIDDEENILSALDRVLRPEGFEIIKAQTDVEAINVLVRDEVAVIICDLLIPGMSGTEILHKCNSISPQSIRIAITGTTDVDLITQTINEGHVSRLILKPWNDDSLVEHVKDAVEHYNLNLENRQLQKVNTRQNKELKELAASLEEKVNERTKALEAAHVELQTSFRETLMVLSEMMEQHIGGLKGHGKRVAVLCLKLAGAIGITDTLALESLEIAALIHDIGLIAVPQEIIQKAEDLQRLHEKRRWRKHSEVGFHLIKQISSLKYVAEVIRAHHENYDGRGFPDGLKGDDIPLESRIIAVCDLFDRVINPLGGEKLGSQFAAEESLEKASGSIIDPEITQVFMTHILPEFVTEIEKEIPVVKLRPSMVLTQDLRNTNNAVLVKYGTVMTAELIAHVLKNEGIDRYLSTAFIESDSLEKYDDDEILDLSLTKFAIKEDEEPKVKTVISVDDEASVINALRRELVMEGYQFEGYTNQKEALERIKKGDVYALVSDFNMPGMTGDKFIELARKYQPELPCVIITAYATRENVMKLLKGGHLSRLLTKPWEKKDLLETLEQFGERH